jgi:chaperonin GroEL (HSP60 family)
MVGSPWKKAILTLNSVADIIRSCLGPKAMLKMLLDPMGGIVLTNDGHAILREIEVSHPAAKSMIELSRTQDEEVGDGTTTVIILGTHTIFVHRALTDRLQLVRFLHKLCHNWSEISTLL